MPETVKVTIDNREYSLVGEDPSLIQNAAKEVDKSIKEIKRIVGDESAATLSILAALNIAEKFIQDLDQSKADKNYLVVELEKMTNYLKRISQ